MSCLVLLTGASGFIGAHVLDQLLKSYRVRIVVRSEAKGQPILKQYSKEVAEKKLEHVIVSDMYSANNFGSAMKGITYVVHVASPFPPYDGSVTDNQKQIIDPAIGMTLSVLEAAAKESTVKRVVITSSFAAIIDIPAGGPYRNHTYTEEDWNPFDLKDLKGAEQSKAYAISKKVAEKSAWEYIEKNKPGYDLVTMNPPVVWGPLLHATEGNLNTSAQYGWIIVDAKELPGDRVPFAVDVRDLATAHVNALSTKEAGGHRFLISSPGYWSYQALSEQVRKQFPALASRIPKGNPGQDIKKPIAVLDSSKAEKILGVTLRPWQESVKDMFEQIIEIKGA